MTTSFGPSVADTLTRQLSSHGPLRLEYQPLSLVRSQHVAVRMIVKCTGRLLLKRHRRTSAGVQREYELGSWRQALAEAEWLRCTSLLDYVVPNDTVQRVALVNGRLVTIPTSHYYLYRLRAIQDLVAGYADDQDRICELGCGTGLNLFSLALAGRGWTLQGYDISLNAIEAARQAAQHFGVRSASFGIIDLTDPSTYSSDLRGTVVLTYYCLEQLKYSTATVIENLLGAGPRRVVHIEPTTELLQLWRPRDLATYLYIASQDYQDNLLRTLEDFEHRGRIRLIDTRRLGWAPTPKHDPTLICWEPV